MVNFHLNCIQFWITNGTRQTDVINKSSEDKGAKRLSKFDSSEPKALLNHKWDWIGSDLIPWEMSICNFIAILFKPFHCFLSMVFGQRYLHLMSGMLRTVDDVDDDDSRRLRETIHKIIYFREKIDTLERQLTNINQELENVTELNNELELRQIADDDDDDQARNYHHHLRSGFS